MNACRLRLYRLAVLAFILSLQASGQSSNLVSAWPQDRLRGQIDDASRVTLRGNTHPFVRMAKGGSAQTGLPMKRMVLLLQSDANQEAQLEQLIAQQHNPKSPQFQKFLTAKDFGDHFGVSENDIDKVVSWLQAQGFSVDEIPAGRRSIVFSGTAEQVSKAFKTEIREYVVGGETHFANASDPQIPAALQVIVSGVAKLHDFRYGKRAAQKKLLNTEALSNPQYTYGNAHYLSPADFATIYNVGPLYSSGIDGTGQSIAIVARSNINLSDVQTFRNQFGLPAQKPAVVIVNSDPGIGADVDEAILDTEWAGALAPRATVKLVVASSTSTADGVDLSAQYIVEHNLAPIMSVSYGACEAYMGSAELAFYNKLWQQAAAQGITVLVSSGDSGAAGCSSGASATGSGRAVNGLCSSPYSVCVGGTQFNEGSNPGQYWFPGNNVVLGSAISYIPEAVWNQSGSTSGLWAGGGGASSVYSKPSWQTGPGVPADGKRDVPDVSLTAATYDGYLIVENGQLWVIGGTSAAAPSFASLMALVNQKTGARQGNANLILYPLAAKQAAGGAAIFHDIVKGNNSVPGVTGYSATTGYDLATGLGSIDAAQMVNHWNDAITAASLTVTAAPTALTVKPGASGTVSATVTPGGSFNSGVALSVAGAPPGVTATLATMNLNAPGSGTVAVNISVSTTAKAGTYTLTISGTGGTLTAKATVALTIPVLPPTLTLTAKPAALTVKRGATATASVTATPGGSFNSAVALSLTGVPSGVTATLGTANLAAPGSGMVAVSITLSKSAKVGTYTVTINGSGGTVSAKTAIVLTIS